MTRKHNWKTKCAALLVGGSMLASGGNCIPDNFWMTQLDNTLTSVVETVVGNTIVSAIDESLGS